MISAPLAVLGAILTICALAFWLESRYGWAQKLGASLLIILFGAALTNLNLVPASSPIYEVILGPVTSLAIVWLLLSVDLRDVLRAGPRMLAAFGIAVAGTMAGAILAALLFGDVFPNDTWRIAAALTGTYAGGSVNFVAIAREVELGDSLFAATVAADNLVTALWIGATLVLPIWLKRFYPHHQPEREQQPADGLLDSPLDLLSAKLRDVLTLGALAAVLVIAADRIAEAVPAVPSVLWLTTSALVAGQLGLVRRLEGSFQMGLLALNLFFAIIGIGSRVSEILSVGLEVLYFTATVVGIHGLVAFGMGRLVRLDVETVAVGSQAAVGGPSSALALTTARRWKRLALPGVLAGLLGYAVGNYAGLAVAALLH